MKKLRLTLLLSFSLSFMTAQSANMQWGEVFGKDIFGTGQAKIFAADETGYYVQAGQKTKNTLYKFDFNNNLIFEKPLRITEENKSYRFTSFAQTNSGLYGVASHLGKYGSQKKVFIGRITNSGVEDFRYFKTYKYNNPVNDNVVDNKDLTEQLKVSKDGLKVVRFDIASTSDYKGGNEKFNIDLFDEKFNLLWERKIELPVKDKSVLIEDVFITNNEAVWLAVKMFDAKARKYHIPYRYNLLKITKNKMETYELELREDLLIASMKIDFDEDKDAAFVSGTFTHSDNRRFVEGIFSGYFNETEKSINYVSIYDFSEEEKEQLNILREHGEKSEKDNSEANNYKVRELIKLPDGNYKTVVEFSRFDFIKENGTLIGYMAPYRLRDFIIFNTKTNEISDVTFIERRMGALQDYDSFFTIRGDKSYLFYTHYPTKKECKEENVGNGSFVWLVKIFDVGNQVISTEILLDTKETKMMFPNIHHIRFGDKVILGGIYMKMTSFFPGSAKRNYRYGSYELK